MGVESDAFNTFFTDEEDDFTVGFSFFRATGRKVRTINVTLGPTGEPALLHTD